MPGEKALSQQEIDALLSGSAGARPAPAASPQAPPAPPATPVVPPGVYRVTLPQPETPPPSVAQAAPPGVPDALQAQLNAIRSDIEGMLRRLDTLEGGMRAGPGQAQPARLPAGLQDAPVRLEGIETRLKQIDEKLRGSLGFGVKEQFHCRQCGTSALVAVHYKCTKCGSETWWGWWPPRAVR